MRGFEGESCGRTEGLDALKKTFDGSGVRFGVEKDLFETTVVLTMTYGAET